MSKEDLTLKEEILRVKNIYTYNGEKTINEADDELDLSVFDDEPGDEQPGDEPPMDNGQLDGEPMDEPMGDTEVDVSDLVTGIEDANNSAEQTKMALDNSVQMINSLLGKVDGLASKVQHMDVILAKVNDLAISVEKMRPPTENERQDALKDQSYPFNTSLDDYTEEGRTKTATELEKKKHKLSFQDILNDFNEQDVGDSFKYEDPIENEINNIVRPYRN